MAKKLTDALLSTMERGANATVPKGLSLSFNVANPEAIAFARKQSAKLIADIAKDARAAIRDAVTAGFENGLPPADTAKLIRSMIGLTERDAGAVMKAQLQMLADGVNADLATARAERYAQKLLNARADTIARTETMRASNEGQTELWSQAQDAGLLSGDEMKVWITADPCDICAELEGETVGINETFSIGDDPPAHPNCRCTIGLVAA